MFDPFGDFETHGYLRNIESIKDLAILKRQEHVFFESNIERALKYLRDVEGHIRYKDFLNVHKILFEEFYPWAGQDRHSLKVARLVSKGGTIQFEVSESCQRAIEWGLEMGNNAQTIRARPGQVMGAFAWGHPFLDGNGRTMLLVHSELCRRAGFSIDWVNSNKADYLTALTFELDNPAGKHLDSYLIPLICQTVSHADLLNQLQEMPGLDGQGTTSAADISYRADDQAAMMAYEVAKRSRGEYTN
ncbi:MULTISPECIES: Fic/DOC family protein [Pseudomonas]|uniref:protein adenylyltransferase n=1 Tax=Pseudomonas fluorescens TaxID=294 RepID=A0A0F4SSK4_PSEFL|nr:MULTISPECIES: Fic family protein [Pseudomonas]KJZ34884.1 cell filamentation protein [Pseudomonas fluorescens]